MVLLEKPRIKSSKVAAPKPVDIPSFKSRSSGLGPAVSLVRGGQTGWGNIQRSTSGLSEESFLAETNSKKSRQQDNLQVEVPGPLILDVAATSPEQPPSVKKTVSAVDAISWAEIDEDMPFESSLSPILSDTLPVERFAAIEIANVAPEKAHQRYFAPTRFPIPSPPLTDGTNAWLKPKDFPNLLLKAEPSHPISENLFDNSHHELKRLSKRTEKAPVPDWMSTDGPSEQHNLAKPIRILKRASLPDNEPPAESRVGLTVAVSALQQLESANAAVNSKKVIAKRHTSRIESEDASKSADLAGSAEKPKSALLATLKIIKNVPSTKANTPGSRGASDDSPRAHHVKTSKPVKKSQPETALKKTASSADPKKPLASSAKRSAKKKKLPSANSFDVLGRLSSESSCSSHSEHESLSEKMSGLQLIKQSISDLETISKNQRQKQLSKALGKQSKPVARPPKADEPAGKAPIKSKNSKSSASNATQIKQHSEPPSAHPSEANTNPKPDKRSGRPKESRASKMRDPEVKSKVISEGLTSTRVISRQLSSSKTITIVKIVKGGKSATST